MLIRNAHRADFHVSRILVSAPCFSSETYIGLYDTYWN